MTDLRSVDQAPENVSCAQCRELYAAGGWAGPYVVPHRSGHTVSYALWIRRGQLTKLADEGYTQPVESVDKYCNEADEGANC